MTKILPSDYNFVLPCAPETLVRLGIDKDGGYIVDKKIIDKTNILVSFGMADEYSFEKEFLKKNEQKRVFIFDYSISKRFYIQEIFKNIRRLLKFKRKFKDLKNTLNTYANFKEYGTLTILKLLPNLVIVSICISFPSIEPTNLTGPSHIGLINKFLLGL